MARRRKKRLEPFVTERYNIQNLHEEREYGLFWYAWLWKLLRPVLIFVCAALIVIGMVTFGWKYAYDALFAPVDALSTEVVEFTVENGASVSSVGNALQREHLLKNSRIFNYMIQFKGLTNSLSYGTYRLSPAMTVDDIIGELTGGSQNNERVITIIPGWTVEDIADYLVGIGALQSRDAFLQQCANADRFAGTSYALSAAQKSGSLAGRKYALEGYLAPDTYRVFLSASPESILSTLLQQNNKVIDEIFYTDYTEYTVDEEGNYTQVETYQSDLTMDETIILASMIEKEGANEQDYARVSAVFHNRLKMGWKLESDPTASYLTRSHRLILPEEELNDQNAYNTYYVPALPVGPICNPSKAALFAALNPDLSYIQDGYLYFCATEPGSGTLAFARTLEEHEANVAQYRPMWEAYDSAIVD